MRPFLNLGDRVFYNLLNLSPNRVGLGSRYLIKFYLKTYNFMRTDTIFYQLFLTFHSLLFELLGQPLENADYYQFTSAEIKEKSFRFDGIFMPSREDKPIYFVEVQFQNKPDFYWELIAEINIYLNQ